MKIENLKNTVVELEPGDIVQSNSTKLYYLIVEIEDDYTLVSLNKNMLIGRRDNINELVNIHLAGNSYTIYKSENITLTLN